MCGQRNLANVIQFRYGAKVIIPAGPECNHRCPYQEEARRGLTKEEKQCDLRHYKCTTGFIEEGAKAKACKENSLQLEKLHEFSLNIPRRTEPCIHLKPHFSGNECKSHGAYFLCSRMNACSRQYGIKAGPEVV